MDPPADGRLGKKKEEKGGGTDTSDMQTYLLQSRINARAQWDSEVRDQQLIAAQH